MQSRVAKLSPHSAPGKAFVFHASVVPGSGLIGFDYAARQVFLVSTARGVRGREEGE